MPCRDAVQGSVTLINWRRSSAALTALARPDLPMPGTETFTGMLMMPCQCVVALPVSVAKVASSVTSMSKRSQSSTGTSNLHSVNIQEATQQQRHPPA